MPFEVEIKLKIREMPDFREHLSRLNVTHHMNLEHIDRYYNLPEQWGNFAQTDEALRLRTTREFGIKNTALLKEIHDITYKGPKLDKKIKARIEHVCHLVEVEKMDTILQVLGFQKVTTLTKKREVYTLSFQDHTIECLIDEVKGLDGWYFEAEIMAEDKAGMEHAKEILRRLVKSLDYQESECITESYLELFLQSNPFL
ncbi:MAG: class IV adenylate cyclase [Candidatus Heimdallarchaeota archaeon]|nr:class IV adenylate cyclase [Candidatus Heimdallarchaeota archaeon]